MCPPPWVSLRGSSPPGSAGSRRMAWDDPARSSWWPGWAGTSRAAAQEPRGADVHTLLWHPYPECEGGGGCCPQHLPAPAVPREDSPGPQGHPSLGSTKTVTSPTHHVGTPDTGVTGQQHPPGVGDCCFLASPHLVPGGIVPRPDMASMWSPLSWADGTPAPQGFGGWWGTLPRLPACPRKPPCAVSQRGGEGWGSHRGGFVRRAKASRARQPGRLPLPRSCLPVPRSFLLRLSGPDVPPSPLPWHPGSAGPGQQDMGEPFVLGSAAGLYVTAVAGGSPSSLPRPQLPSQTSLLAPISRRGN